MREAIAQIGISATGASGIVSAVAQNVEVQNLVVGLVSALIIQVVLRVSKFFKKKDVENLNKD